MINLTHLSTTQDGVFASVIRMIFGWDLKNGGHRGRVSVDDVSDQLCYVLIDEDDVDVIPLDEPLETFLNLTHCCVWNYKGYTM